MNQYCRKLNLLLIIALIMSLLQLPTQAAIAAEGSLVEKLKGSVILYIGSSSAFADNTRVKIDTENPEVVPLVKNGRTLVPVRFIAESVNAKVEWNSAESAAIITQGNKTVKLTLDSNRMLVNGTEVLLDVPAESINGRVYIPLRALVETALGKKIFFDRDLIVISDKENLFDKNSEKQLVDQVISFFNDTADTQPLVGGIPTDKGNTAATPPNETGSKQEKAESNSPVINFVSVGAGLNAVIWDGSKYLAVGNKGTIITSYDGNVWSGQDSGVKENLTNICWSGSKYVCIGEKSTILTSTNGVDWEKQAVIFDRSNNFITFKSVTFYKGSFIAIGSDSSVFSSVGGATWDLKAEFRYNTICGITNSGNKLVVAGHDGSVFTSEDGIKWDKKITGVNSILRGIYWEGGRFVAVGDQGAILTSPDGEKWVKGAVNGKESFYCAALTKNNQIIAGGDQGIIVTSSDGKDWSIAVSNTVQCIRGIATASQGMIAITDNGCIFVSNDGVTWTQKNSYISETLNDIVYDGNRFIAVGNKGTLCNSSDGVSWVLLDKDTAAIPNSKMSHLRAVAYNKNRIIVAGEQGILMSSKDGLSWEKDQVGVDEFQQISCNENTFVALGGLRRNTSQLPYFNPGAYFVPDSVSGLASNAAYIINNEMKSERVSDIPSNILLSSAWGNGVFVAVGLAGSIYTSIDGKEWIRRNSGTTNILLNIAWDGNRFIAVGYAGTVVTSPDGEKWTILNTEIKDALISVTWSGSEFAALSAKGNVYAFSDEVKWIQTKLNASNRLNKIVWGGDKYVIIGQDGVIITLKR